MTIRIFSLSFHSFFLRDAAFFFSSSGCVQQSCVTVLVIVYIFFVRSFRRHACVGALLKKTFSFPPESRPRPSPIPLP